MSVFLDALAAAAVDERGLVTTVPAGADRSTGGSGERRQSWALVRARADAMTAALDAAGVAAGDAVAVLAGRPADIAPLAQAIWRRGASVTMLHQPTARTDLTRFAEHTAGALSVIGAAWVVLGEPFDSGPFAAAAPMLRAGGVRVLTLAELDAAPDAGQDPGRVPADAEVAEDALALLQLTSGSTATPKAVRITHGNLWANITSMRTAAGLDPARDTMVSWLPLFHDMGMVGFLTLPMCLSLNVVSATPAEFLRDPLLWLRLISDHGGTATAAPNFAYAITARALARSEAGAGSGARLDLSTLRFALNGAEPVDVAACEAFLAAGKGFGLPSTALVPAYGMAEAVLGVSFHQWGTPLSVDTVDAAALENRNLAVPVAAPVSARAAGAAVAGHPAEAGASAVAGELAEDGAADGGSAVEGGGEAAGGAAAEAAGADRPGIRRFPTLGPPLPGMDVRVVGPDGEVLGRRQVGELQIRGANVTAGYLTVDGPQDTLDADGWLATGDLGYLIETPAQPATAAATDDTGADTGAGAGTAVVVCGRVKDIIIMGGRNLYPTDIERLAEQVPGVRAGNAAAVTWRTPQGRESFAVLAESRQASDAARADQIADGIRSAVTGELGVRPAAVRVLPVGTLPKTPSGKIQRAAAAELLAADRS